MHAPIRMYYSISLRVVLHTSHNDQTLGEPQPEVVIILSAHQWSWLAVLTVCVTTSAGVGSVSLLRGWSAKGQMGGS